jgi:hypothetical protein
MSAAAIFGIGIAVGKGHRVQLIRVVDQEHIKNSQTATPSDEIVIDPAALTFPKELLAERPDPLANQLSSETFPSEVPKED